MDDGGAPPPSPIKAAINIQDRGTMYAAGLMLFRTVLLKTQTHRENCDITELTIPVNGGNHTENELNTYDSKQLEDCAQMPVFGDGVSDLKSVSSLTNRGPKPMADSNLGSQLFMLQLNLNLKNKGGSTLELPYIIVEMSAEQF